MELPTLDFELTTSSGERGWIGTWYAHESDESMDALNMPYESQRIDETRVFISTSAPKGITRRWTMRLEGHLKPRVHDCSFEFGLIVSGRAKVDTPFPFTGFAVLIRLLSSSLLTASLSLITGRVNAVGRHSSIVVLKKRRVVLTSKRASNTTSSSSSATLGLLPTVTRTRQSRTIMLVSNLVAQRSKIQM